MKLISITPPQPVRTELKLYSGQVRLGTRLGFAIGDRFNILRDADERPAKTIYLVKDAKGESRIGAGNYLRITQALTLVNQKKAKKCFIEPFSHDGVIGHKITF